MLGGLGACSLGNFLIKMGQSGRSKYVITSLKINNFKDNKSTTPKHYCHIFLSDQSRCACKYAQKTFIIYNGGLGDYSPEAEEILKNRTNWRFFLYFIYFCFCSLKIITSAPQIPENK